MHFHHISGVESKSPGDNIVVREFETSSEIFGYVWVLFEKLVTPKQLAAHSLTGSRQNVLF